VGAGAGVVLALGVGAVDEGIEEFNFPLVVPGISGI
jgi:hypothetical protein